MQVRNTYIVKIENRLQFLFETFTGQFFINNGNFLTEISQEDFFKLVK